MVAKQAGDRFQSMTEVIAALEECKVGSNAHSTAGSAVVRSAVQLGPHAQHGNSTKQASGVGHSTVRGRPDDITVALDPAAIDRVAIDRAALDDANLQNHPGFVHRAIRAVLGHPMVSTAVGGLLIAAAATCIVLLSGNRGASNSQTAAAKSDTANSNAAESADAPAPEPSVAAPQPAHPPAEKSNTNAQRRRPVTHGSTCCR